MTTAQPDVHDVLTSFLSWSDIADQVRRCTASNSVYRRAIGHPEARIRRDAFLRFRGDSDLMTLAVHDLNNEVRQVAAASRATPPALLGTLIGDRSRVVRELLVQNPSAPDFVREHLVHDPTHEVRVLVAAQPLSTTALEHLSRDSATAVRRVVASRRDLPAHIATSLADDTNDAVLHTLASNSNVPLNVAQALTGRGHRSLRSAVARSTRHPEVLDMLADDPDLAVRTAVSLNGALPTTTAQRMLRTRSIHLRFYLLERHHENLPDELVDRILDDLLSLTRGDYRASVREIFAERISPRDITSPPDLHDRRGLFEVVDQQLPFDLIAHAVLSEALPPTVRAALMMHPNITAAVRTSLRDHPNAFIQRAACTPRHLLTTRSPRP